ncbi:MAG TPA: ATP-binding protein [Nitrososphaera sp.]|nr:ATP-binding protein [Nitrososphaera sp.]
MAKSNENRPILRENNLKIAIKIIISFLAVAAVAALAAASYLQPLAGAGAPAGLVQAIVIIVASSIGVLGALLAVLVLLPLRKIGSDAEQIARGNYNTQVYDGKLTKGKFRSSDELSRLVMAFEVMRRKVVEVDTSLGKQIEIKTFDLQRVNDELVEKEKALQRTNAKLSSQSEDLQNMNQELSAKNEELSDANAKLQKLDKMKTDFILIAAHELRTPIQPIMGSVKLAEKGLITNEQAWKTIVTDAKRLSTVATYILDVGKIESGNMSYDMKPLRVSQLIEHISSSSTKFATQDGVISIRMDLDEDVQIMGDRERLVQAFANIIDNAAKFAKNGTITIQTVNNHDGGQVEIKIMDDGPGIPDEILPVLFNKFVTKTKENERGTGLGLFITKAIVEAHSGRISAVNNAGDNKGATFTVSFPIHQKEAPSMTVTE